MDHTYVECQICNRQFSNGKALGGHMRSHFAKAPVAASSGRDERAGFQVTDQSMEGNPTPKNSCGFVKNNDQEIIFTMQTLSGDCSEDTISDEIHSSVVLGLDTSREDQDAARCLIMLSRDIWKDDGNDEDVHDEEDAVVNYGSDDDEDESFSVNRVSLDRIVQAEAKYKCETCNKKFKSYQALGGHRSSHSNSNNLATKQRIFKCSYCPRVFESGQALGGHKKVHGLFKNPITVDLNFTDGARERFAQKFNGKFESFMSF